MKKVIFLFLFGVLVNHLKAQERQEVKSTTREEYNYATKGYRVQLESGLDQKKGYNIMNLETVTYSSYSFDFKLLMRSADSTLAGVMVLAHSKAWNNKYYLCIPINNEELMDEYQTSISTWDRAILFAYSNALTAIMPTLMYSVTEYERELLRATKKKGKG